MDSCDVYYLGETVGKATLKRDGLYCRIQCRCKKLDGMIRLVAKCEKGDTVIGVCIPQGDVLVLEKSIPAKQLENCYFELVGDAERPGCFAPLEGPLPTECLRSLEKTRLVDRNGIKGLCY